MLLILAESGYDGLTIDEVAARVGAARAHGTGPGNKADPAL
jgi:AcrR family transcriptional regulator